MSWIVYFSKLVSPNFQALAKDSNAIQIVTIGFSHYCELAIWSLKLKGIPFKEHSYAPVQHIFAAIALRMGGNKKHFSGSSRVCEVVDPKLSAEQNAAKTTKEIRNDARARSTAVPVAILPDGSVWKDSWEIAAHVGMTDATPSLKILLDEKIGTLARQLADHYILQPRNSNIWNAMCTDRRSWLWRFAWWAFLGNYATNIMISIMKPFNPEAVADCRAKLNAAIQELDSILDAKTTPFISGEIIGLADIAVASLLAPLLNPAQYCEGKYAHLYDQLVQQDAELRSEVERLRITTSGKYAMNIYAKYR